jgi:hypothetical protein
MQNAPKDPTPRTSKAIHYNENVEEFASSGKVEESARKAKEALDDDEQAVELQRAETKGRSPANRPGSLGKTTLPHR